MTQKKSSGGGIAKTFVEIYRQMLGILRENPTVWLLFLFIAILDGLALTALFLAPSKPFSIILAPLIRTFYSDVFLHYPDNFILLPKLFNYTHFLILTVVGIVTTGVVIKKIEAHCEGQKLSTLSAAGPVFKKYFSLLVAWLISYGFFTGAFSLLMPLLPPSIVFQVAVAFMLGIFIQALFAFLLPAILITGNGFLKDIWSGFLVGAKNLVTTGLIIAVPILFVVAISFLKALGPLFLNVYPEIILWILGVGIVITMVVDLLITTSTTLLYLKVRK